jgi:methyl-accepting chemotaxis protein
LEQLVSLADEAADSTEQSATMTLEIEAQMSSLKQAVDRFKV